MKLTSSAFHADSPIPAKYTCDGQDLSPPLAWEALPPGTRSLALLVDDPDAPDPAAPKRVWVHWIVYDLPPSPALLPEGAGNRSPKEPVRFARTDSRKPGYHGPCPPIGRHRYFFKLYALDTTLGELKPPTKQELEAAMEDHVLAHAELIGTYQQAKRR